MAGFLKQLIDLGEERSVDDMSRELPEDVDGMNRDQLVRLTQRLHADTKQKKDEFDALRTESAQLRSEYDAYKLKVESWQLKMKEARDEDKRLIAQLRAAGTSGNTDELFVKSMNDTIAKYKEELRAARDDVAKEYRRRQDTEEARSRFEEAKKFEMDELVSKFDKTREQMKRSQLTTEAKLKASEGRVAALEKELVLTKSQYASSPAGGSQPPSDAVRSQTSDVECEKLQSIVDDLKEQLERANKAAEDAQWETLEREKVLAESRSICDTIATKLTASETEREKVVQNFALEEKKLLRQVRVAEEELAAVKEAHIVEDRTVARTVSDLRAEIDRLSSEARARAEAVGAAEQSSVRAAEALGAERRVLEAQIAGLERRVTELDLTRQGLQGTVDELRVDIRQRNSLYDDLRKELEDQAMRAADLEAQMSANYATVTKREDDVIAREREKQSLKHQLSIEKDQVERLRRQLKESEERLEEERERLLDAQNRMRDLEGDRLRLQTEIRLEAQKVSDGAVGLEAAQRMMRDLQLQLSEQGSRTADVVRLREDQSAKVRQLEAKLKETEHRLQTAQAAPRTDASVPVRPLPSAVLSSAFAQPRALTWSQTKYGLAGILFLFLVLGFLNSLGNAPTGRTVGGDTDSLIIVKEKYSQALEAAVSCRESLKTMCACPPPNKGS